jgi:hypothetical protein
VLIVALSHFPKLKAELELLGCEHNADLIEDEVDALWTRCAWPRTHWHQMFLPRLPVALLMARGSSISGSLCSQLFAFV